MFTKGPIAASSSYKKGAFHGLLILLAINAAYEVCRGWITLYTFLKSSYSTHSENSTAQV